MITDEDLATLHRSTATLHRSTAMLSPGQEVRGIDREQLLDLTRELIRRRGES